MKYQLFGLFCTLLLGMTWKAEAQTAGAISKDGWQTLHNYEDTVALLAYAIVNDSLPENRFGACRAMIPKLVEGLKTPNSFHYPFDRIQSISIRYPQDSSFRIFTWQLYVDVDDYRYYGAIQMNTPELKLYPLIDRSFELQGDLKQQVLTKDDWYGAVYYNLKEVDGPDGKYYLLFGFDGYSFFQKRKIVDVLTFQAGEPRFGAPVFVGYEGSDPGATVNRLILEYSADASVKLNYEETMDMLVFDHLIEMGGQYGEGMTYYPDGSYEGYELKNGRWVYVPKLYTEILDEAPRPTPILDQRGRNIFGKNR